MLWIGVYIGYFGVVLVLIAGGLGNILSKCLTNNVISVDSSSKPDASTTVNAGYPCETWFMAGGGIDVKESTIYRAVKSWIPKHKEPLVLEKGEIVRIEREDNEYKGFAWCERGGKYGWVPFEIIELIDDNRGRVKEDYSSRELELSIGDELKGSKKISGWILGERIRSGEVGWVPLSCIKELSSV